MSEGKQCISEQIDRIFAPWDRIDSPGAAVAVVRGGEVVFSRGYGCAQLEYDVPITPSTVFHVASVSKQFTAAAVALLAQEGVLSLEDDIRTHLPDIPDFGPTITIRHLIHHTSGLRDQWELLRLAGWRMDDVITEEHIRKKVRHQRELNFAPGDEHLYSNTGYTLMACIVAQVSGLSFREFTAANLFRPLQMHSTHFHDDHCEIVPGRAYSYTQDADENLQISPLNYANVGATSLFTTVEDLARWLVNLDTGSIGGRQLTRKLHERFTLNSGETIPYAFGLQHAEYRGLRVVGHSGADAGFRSFCGRFVDCDLGVVVLSNMAQFDPHEMAMRVAELYLEADMCERTTKIPDAEVPLLDRERLQACAGTYLLDSMGSAEVWVSDGGLQLQLGEGPSAKLQPVGGLRFAILPAGRQVEFCLDGERAERFTLEAGARTLTAERYRRHYPTPDRLEKLAGQYWSPELQAGYEVRTDETEDSLILRHVRHSDVHLLPISDSAFQSRGSRPGRIDFIEQDGEIVGLTVTGSRVRDLHFDREVR